LVRSKKGLSLSGGRLVRPGWREGSSLRTQRGRGVEETLAEETRGCLNRAGEIRKLKRPWERWIQASLGFRNYWYPAALSHHVRDGGSLSATLLGEEILLVRQEGRIFAVEDRCVHRGARFSKRPLFYTTDTITCWYHTFTFNLDDGKLRCVLNEPGCPMVGKVGIRTYPVREAKGVIFVFVGDIDPPDLRCDVPPGFLDEEMAICLTEPYEVKANWRLGCENGFDPSHHFIHNWSQFTLNARFPVTMGFVSKKGKEHEAMTFSVEEPGPKGFTRKAEGWELIFESTIPGREPSKDVKVTVPWAKGMMPEQLAAMFEGSELSVGLWLPCGLRVNSFPYPGLIHYEWYVPKDAQTHTYFQFGGKPVKSPEEARAWVREDGHNFWEVQVPKGFTTEDAFAREGLEKFYAEEDGWHRERLYRPDIEITMWRKFASEHARGVQP
jgi:carbazole 1,9a-dioxygenase terminal dioxygenase component